MMLVPPFVCSVYAGYYVLFSVFVFSQICPKPGGCIPPALLQINWVCEWKELRYIPADQLMLVREAKTSYRIVVCIYPTCYRQFGALALLSPNRVYSPLRCRLKKHFVPLVS